MARALAWHARGHRFDPDILHTPLYEDAIFDILTHKTVSKDFFEVELSRLRNLKLQLKV